MDIFWHDLRFSLRTLIRNSWFTFVAVSTLALGIAATSAIATVVSAVLLHDLPYPEPDRLLLLESYKNELGVPERFSNSYLDYKDWKARSKAFEEVGAYSSPFAFNLSSEGEPERATGEIVDSSYFRLLRVKPVVGRTFTLEEDAKVGELRVVVLSHALWQQHFGGDPQVVGKKVVVDGESYQVVGVAPARFRGISDEADLWLPLTMSNEILGNNRFLNKRRVRWLLSLARLNPGVSLNQAQQEMDSISVGMAREFPENEHMIVRLKTLKQALFGDLRFSLLTLLGASLFVLLIAWTAVANLLLARAMVRQREMAVRDALGATRRQLIRQLLTESLVLAGISSVLGLILAYWATGLLVAASAVKFQSFVNLGLNLPVVVAIVALSLLCGVIFGLAPGWFGLRASLTILREGGSSTGVDRQRFQSSLVVAEVALALFLLVGAGLMIKGFQHLRQTNLGFQPKNLLTLRVDLKGKRYADAKVMIPLARQCRDRLRAIPGIASVSIEGPAMPTDGWYASYFIVEDLLPKTKDGAVNQVFHHVSPGYFKNLGIPLLAGREFTEADTEASPRVIVISQALVRRYWPHESPLGKRMRFGRSDPNAPWFTVVGVVGDLNQQAMQPLEWPGPDAYFALFQFPPLLTPQLSFLVRSAGVPLLSLVAPVESELRIIAPDLPPFDADAMEHRLDVFTAKGRFLVLLMSLFAGLALLIATTGLYSVLSYSVTQRTRELGIRVALGAQTRDVLRLVVGRAMALATLGLVIGLVAATGLTRLFATLLYGVSPTDPLTFIGASFLLFLVATAATYIPARRAIKVQPVIAFKTE